MALKALSIVKEEIARAKASTPRVRHALLEILEEVITDRIETECLELPGVNDEPDVDAEKDEGFFDDEPDGRIHKEEN